jgi:uncharacterized protein YqgV (UPF0045/DUF77 family)
LDRPSGEDVRAPNGIHRNRSDDRRFGGCEIRSRNQFLLPLQERQPAKIIDASGMDYRLTAAGTIIEGRWDQLMDVARRCHTEMRQKIERVITFIKINDYGNHAGRLTGAIASIEEKLRKPMKK